MFVRASMPGLFKSCHLRTANMNPDTTGRIIINNTSSAETINMEVDSDSNAPVTSEVAIILPTEVAAPITKPLRI